MIATRKDLYRYLKDDLGGEKHFSVYSFFRSLFIVPINDTRYIRAYIRTLRYAEFHLNVCSKGLVMAIIHKLMKIYYFWKLRKYS